MVRVMIELVPHGVEDLTEPLGLMLIINNGTGTREHGNYDVVLSTRTDMGEVWQRGQVEGCPREFSEAGVYGLVFQALQSIGAVAQHG